MPEVLSALTPIAAAPITRSALGLGNASLASAGSLQCGRLTLTSGDAVTTSDVSGSTIYFAPWQGNVVSLYDGADFVPYAFSQLSRSISGLTSGKNYDVFAYLSGGAVAIDLAPAWTNDTTRSAAVSLLNGVYVNTSSFTPVMGGGTVAASRGTLIGTIRTTGTNTTEDSRAKRLVSNVWHPVARLFYRFDSTFHTYTSTTIRGWNNQNTHTVEWVQCLPTNATLLTFQGAIGASTTGTQGARLGIGPSATTQNMVLDINAGVIFGGGFPVPMGAAAGWQCYFVTESGTGSGNSSFFFFLVGGMVWN